MNENIKALAEQAGIKFVSADIRHIRNTSELEKFAELLLKKCLDKVAEYEIVKNGTPSYPLYDRIFKYFGVKE